MLSRRVMRAQNNTTETPLENFTLAVLPDTQKELWTLWNVNTRFRHRLSWLATNKAALNLKYVVHSGDLQDTDNLIFSSDKSVNPRYISASEWTIDHFQYHHASEGLKILETASIPFLACLGNHDTGAVCGGSACPIVAGQTAGTRVEVRNTTTWNTYYPPSRYPGIVTFEPGKTDNAYRTFSTGGLNWLVLTLELWPRTEVINWAKTVAQTHLTHNIIVLTHSYLNGDGSIYTGSDYGANSPQFLFDNLIKVYPNFKFVFCGHVGNSALRTDTGINGNKIYSMLQCYHDDVNNWIRLLSINPSNHTVQSEVYAPRTAINRGDAGDAFTLTNVQFVS